MRSNILICRSICRSLFCLSIHINILFVNIYFYLIRIIADYFADVVGNGKIASSVRFYDFRSCTFQHLCRTPGFRGCVTMSLRRSEAIEAIPDVLGKTEIAALPSVAPDEQRQFTEGKIPLYPPLEALFRFAGLPGKEFTFHVCAPWRDAPPVQRGKI